MLSHNFTVVLLRGSNVVTQDLDTPVNGASRPLQAEGPRVGTTTNEASGKRFICEYMYNDCQGRNKDRYSAIHHCSTTLVRGVKRSPCQTSASPSTGPTCWLRSL